MEVSDTTPEAPSSRLIHDFTTIERWTLNFLKPTFDALTTGLFPEDDLIARVLNRFSHADLGFSIPVRIPTTQSSRRAP